MGEEVSGEAPSHRNTALDASRSVDKRKDVPIFTGFRIMSHHKTSSPGKYCFLIAATNVDHEDLVTGTKRRQSPWSGNDGA